MGDYGKAAVNATNFVKSGRYQSPVTAWQVAVSAQFPASQSSQKKSCPRGAYLGLCEMGLVCGIPVGHYTDSQKNKSYAVSALNQLCINPSLASNFKALWIAAGCPNIKLNNQMDVVLALWNIGLLKCPSKDDGQQSSVPGCQSASLHGNR
jgi:hypothetical protein